MKQCLHKTGFERTFLLNQCLAMLIGLCVSSQVFAGGYRVATQGQKALGMGHAGVAMAESAETVFFNPAAMSELSPELQIVTGLTLIDTKNRYQNEALGSSAETDTPLAAVPNVYITKAYNKKLTLGFGFYAPYGSAVEWEKDWSGSHLINDIELSAVFLQPTLSYKINDTYSIGGGPIVAIGAVELNRNLSTSLQNSNGRSNLTLEDSGVIEFGFTLGAFMKVNDDLDLGINYRSEIIIESEGDADFDNIPAPLQSTFVDGGYESELPLPAELTLGLAYDINDKLKFAADYNYTFWDVYEALRIEFDSVNDASSNPSNNPRNYKNSSTYRFGLQYTPTDTIQYRGGLYYDETPIRDGYFAPETPRTNALGMTAGLTWSLSKHLQLDFSAFYLYFGEEDNSYDFSSSGPFEGTYKVRAYSLGFGLTYKL